MQTDRAIWPEFKRTKRKQTKKPTKQKLKIDTHDPVM